MDNTLQVIEQTYKLYKKLTLLNTSLPRVHRYGLGEKTLILALELVENLVYAKNSPRSSKLPYLLRANTKLEVVKLNLRIYLSEELANKTTIWQIDAIVSNIGRQLGGWMKSLK
jgi:hypothetical protein